MGKPACNAEPVGKRGPVEGKLACSIVPVQELARHSKVLEPVPELHSRALVQVLEPVPHSKVLERALGLGSKALEPELVQDSKVPVPEQGSKVLVLVLEHSKVRELAPVQDSKVRELAAGRLDHRRVSCSN